MARERVRAAQQGLTDQDEGQVPAGVHLEVEHGGQEFERFVAEHLRLVEDQDRMPLVGPMEADDGFGDMVEGIGASEGGFEIEAAGQQAQQIEGGAGGPLQVAVGDIEQIKVEGGQEGADGGGLAGADLSSEKADAPVLDEKLQTGAHLGPGRCGEELPRFGVGTEGGSLNPKKVSNMCYSSRSSESGWGAEQLGEVDPGRLWGRGILRRLGTGHGGVDDRIATGRPVPWGSPSR
jgi:hypothetical protein